MQEELVLCVQTLFHFGFRCGDLSKLSLGCGMLHRRAGVGGDVTVLVRGGIQVQDFPVYLQSHASTVEGSDRRRNHRYF